MFLVAIASAYVVERTTAHQLLRDIDPNRFVVGRDDADTFAAIKGGGEEIDG